MTQHPIFSIVIPTYARPERLTNCLQAIAPFNYPSDRFEVIVVDNGSPTSVETVAAPFRNQLHLTLIRQVNAESAKARNADAEQVNGQFSAFIDDNCAPASDWLKRLESHFTATLTASLEIAPSTLCPTASIPPPGGL